MLRRLEQQPKQAPNRRSNPPRSLLGIDAPETHPPRCDYEARLGNEATEKLQALLNSGAVTMTSIDRDRDVYGRLLRNVAVNGADVGEAMVSAGVAREYGSGRRSWC